MNAFDDYVNGLHARAQKLDQALDKLAQVPISDLDYWFDKVKDAAGDLTSYIDETKSVLQEFQNLENDFSDLQDHLSELGAYTTCPECPNELNCLMNK